jgi:hypothetical protein
MIRRIHQGFGECSNTIKPSLFNPTSGYSKTGFGGSTRAGR